MNNFIARVSHAYRRYTVSKLLTFTQGVINEMTGNTDYTTPSPTLANMQTAKNDLEAKDAAALTRDKNAIAERNDSRLVLIGMLDELADYVELTALTNITMMQGSGFNLQHAHTKVGELPVPADFFVKVGVNSGEVIARCKGVKGSYSYVLQYTSASQVPDGPWTTIPSNSAKVKVVGLKPGTQVAFRMAAVGAEPSLNFTETISIYVS